MKALIAAFAFATLLTGAGASAQQAAPAQGESPYRIAGRLPVRIMDFKVEPATIEDLDSTNGTHVNGTRISAPTRLVPGDEFALGSEVLRVRLRSSSALTVKVDPESGASVKKSVGLH